MAAPKNRGLGRGLGALIPDMDIDLNEEVSLDKEKATDKSITFLDIEKIIPNKGQPRKHFDEEKIKELAASIKEHGIIQPLVVVKDGVNYLIAAGERRYRASKLAGLKEVPVVIKEFNQKQLKEIALIENLQREDLNEIEEALAYKELKDLYSMTQEEIAKRIGKSRANIANTMRLLNLSEDIQKLLVEDKLSAGHARCILSIEKEELKEKFAKEIIDNNLTVRDTEKLAKEYNKPEKEEQEETREDKILKYQVKEVEEKIANALGTKIKLNHKGNKGSIQINYFSNEELERLVNLFTK